MREKRSIQREIEGEKRRRIGTKNRRRRKCVKPWTKEREDKMQDARHKIKTEESDGKYWSLDRVYMAPNNYSLSFGDRLGCQIIDMNILVIVSVLSTL